MTDTEHLNEAIGSETDSQQYLSFFLNGEEYGIGILQVKEIRGWSSSTPIPSAPAYIKGVVNLRGVIVPIVDLRLRFSLPEKDYDKETVVIVIQIGDDQQKKTVGIVVDAVSDVHMLTSEHIQPPPDMGDTHIDKFISGLATIDEKMMIILALDTLLDTSEIANCLNNSIGANEVTEMNDQES